MTEILKKMLRPVLYRAINLGGKNYIAGETLSDAIKTSEYLTARGYQTTLGYWNKTGESPDSLLKANLDALRAIHQSTGSGYLSVKMPPMEFDVSAYKKLLSQSRKLGVSIHLDSHSCEDAERTLGLITEHTQAPYDSICYTLPGRWKRSLKDAQLAIDRGITVRIVKGQWDDPQDAERDPRLGFMELVERLAGKATKVRIATHDPILVRECVTILQGAGTPCEVELLYGLPLKATLAVAREKQVPVRVYIPYGEGSLPYALEYVRKHPRFLWWLFKDSIQGLSGKRFPKYLMETTMSYK